jgi:gliding motility-associated protein GldM
MSGSKNAPETPRQKMIGMLYLVLLGMLALNVSSEILNGFKMVDDSLHTSVQSMEEQNHRLYTEFRAMNEINPEKVGQWFDKAKLVRTEADELVRYLHQFKVDILKRADKEEADTLYARNVIRKDDVESPAFYALQQGNAAVLKDRLESYRKLLIDLSSDDERLSEAFGMIYNTEPINGKPWANANFENMPVSAVITILSKYQTDVRSSETKIVEYLKRRTDEGSVRVNEFSAFVVAESNYVMEGQPYRANIYLAAVDTTRRPLVFVGGSRLQGNTYTAVPGRTGQFTYSGYIELPPVVSGADPQRLPFSSTYNVGKPAAIISNDDLNVLYRGFDNNISISVPGIATENLRLSITGGTADHQGNGRYIVRPTDNRVELSVTALVGGRSVELGGNTYRVRQLPDPRPYATFRDANGNQQSVFEGSVHGPSFVNGNPSVTAGYGDDALVQANFTVQSFVIRIGRRTYTSNGPRFSQEQLDVINTMPSGTPVTIQRIRAIGPDGMERNLSAVALEVL